MHLPTHALTLWRLTLCCWLRQAEAMRIEHCDVTEGFGASDVALTTQNYGVTFVPRREYLFVADDNFTGAMSGGVDSVNGVVMADRVHVSVARLLREAVPRLQQAFAEQGWNQAAVTAELFADLRVTHEEVTALRLYTGPLFML